MIICLGNVVLTKKVYENKVGEGEGRTELEIELN